MKAFFINPHMPASSWFNTSAAGISPPLGLLSIASYFIEKGNDATILDNSVEMLSEKNIIEKIKRYNPDIIGITSTTTNFNVTKGLVSIIKKETDIPVVLGGHHVSALPEYSIESTEADFVIIGEGEKSFLTLAEKIKNGGSLADIGGLCRRENGKIIANRNIENIEEIKDLKLDYSLLPVEKYRPSLSRRLTSGIFSAVITSRGCPYKCKFCSKLYGEKYLLRNEETVIKEVEFLKRHYNISELIIWDDTFTFEKERAIYLSKYIKKVSSSFWSCYSRVDKADDKLYFELSKNGLKEIVFGAESGNDNILKNIDKKITKEEIKTAISLSKRMGISSFVSVILGLPGETKETIEETIDFFITIDPDYTAFTTLIPFPGSEYFNLAINKGLINLKNTDWDSYVTIFSSKLPPCSLCDLTPKELADMQKYAMRKFLFRPKYIKKHFNKILKEGFFRAGAVYKGAKTVLKHQLHKI
ncbi:MAG: B12-binding domain-containing radical SAM protein [Elusimicrobiales bacterium]